MHFRTCHCNSSPCKRGSRTPSTAAVASACRHHQQSPIHRLPDLCPSLPRSQRPALFAAQFTSVPPALPSHRLRRVDRQQDRIRLLANEARSRELLRHGTSLIDHGLRIARLWPATGRTRLRETHLAGPARSQRSRNIIPVPVLYRQERVVVRLCCIFWIKACQHFLVQGNVVRSPAPRLWLCLVDPPVSQLHADAALVDANEVVIVRVLCEVGRHRFLIVTGRRRDMPSLELGVGRDVLLLQILESISTCTVAPFLCAAISAAM